MSEIIGTCTCVETSLEERVDAIVDRYGADKQFSLAILQDTQRVYNYLPRQALDHIAERLCVSRGEIYRLATFFTAFSLRAKGEYVCKVCLGTACHVLGSPRLLEALERELGIKAGETTPDGKFTLEAVRCLGACALAPVLVVNEEPHGHMTPDKVAKLIADLSAKEPGGAQPSVSADLPIVSSEEIECKRSKLEDMGSLETLMARLQKDLGRVEAGTTITVGMGTCGISAGAREVVRAIQSELSAREIDAQVRAVGCIGMCHMEPLVDIQMGDGPRVTYVNVTPKKAQRIIEEHVVGGQAIDEWAFGEIASGEESGVCCYGDTPFYGKQLRYVMRNCGMIDPRTIEEYIAVGGYQALGKVLLSLTAEEIIEEVKKSGLRGRGGAGFATGRKWDSAYHAEGDPKYVVANGDEGDPGAFMNRSLMEGNPHAIIEGMIIGAYVLGAQEGYIYVRDEYPLAVTNLGIAIQQARQYGLLGENILGSGFDFDIQIVRGAGAFVCGESSALMQSLEGKVGEPHPKHFHATERGLWDRPTILNNVETWANIPLIINRGADWYASIGTERSKGTKTFCLAGQIQRTGLIEVPMGITLREIVYDIGGGIPGGREFKAVQTGGPSGGCIPASLLDLAVDYDSLTEAGSMMGSGGMVVMDDRTCMVDVARYFLDFLKEESCGKCAPCREGIRQMLDILTAITEGRGTMDDVAQLEKTAWMVQQGSLCQLGKSAPNPVLSTLRYFRDEYVAHVEEKRCPGGVCRELITYSIDAEACTGCTLCARNCPQEAISGEKKKPHVIDQELCIRCGVCCDVCRFEAVVVE
jgi:NADH:ubiquinone oxidoreductase subunit F (NADH-binding)/NADH:ubiquinone oxidoreductase subunit E/NAD-dependent dihydropyrimidine dehydrogenase PreA subunit